MFDTHVGSLEAFARTELPIRACRWAAPVICRRDRGEPAAYGCVMRVAFVAATVAVFLAGCGSGTKTVDYDWSNTSVAVRQAAIAAVQSGCNGTPPAPSSGVDFDPNDYRPDPQCVNEKAAARFDTTLGPLRAQAVEKVCASTGASRVRITWVDFSTDRITEMIACNDIPKTIQRRS